MKEQKTGSRTRRNFGTVYSMLFVLAFLAGCCGNNAAMDMVMARANGSIELSERITADELYIIINNHFGKVNVKIIDYAYDLPDNGKVVELSGQTHCGTRAAGIEGTAGWDCDDYAIAAMVPLRNYAFGTMYVKTASGRRHAMNVFVNRNREVVYWEPQSCQYYNGRFYKPDLIIF